MLLFVVVTGLGRRVYKYFPNRKVKLHERWAGQMYTNFVEITLFDVITGLYLPEDDDFDDLVDNWTDVSCTDFYPGEWTSCV